jgi:hypothetical protein
MVGYKSRLQVMYVGGYSELFQGCIKNDFDAWKIAINYKSSF